MSSLQVISIISSSLLQRAVEQINGREGETATFIRRCVVNFTLTLAVSPHVNSIVRFLLVSTKRAVKVILFKEEYR